MNEHELAEAIRIRDVVRQHGDAFHAQGVVDPDAAQRIADLVRPLDVAEVFTPLLTSAELDRDLRLRRDLRLAGVPDSVIDEVFFAELDRQQRHCDGGKLTDASDIFGDDVPAWMRDATVTIDVDASEARRSTATGANMPTSPIGSQLEPALTRVELLAAALAGLVLGAALAFGGLAVVNAIADVVEQGQP
jgi:hypothetical protein